MTENQTPAGWYPDGSGAHRWWDGSQWTDEFRDGSPQQDSAPNDQTPRTKSQMAKFGKTFLRAGLPSVLRDKEAEKEQVSEARRFLGDVASRNAAGAKLVKAAEEKQAANRALKDQNTEMYGGLVLSQMFGVHTVQIYDRGFVRVGVVLTAKSPFEKLRSIKYSHFNQDKSAGGRALAGVATMGLNYLASKEKRTIILTIATDKKVHVLRSEDADNAALALEAAGQSVLDVPPATAATAPQSATPDLADQIKKLADLRDAGILTDEEFNKKKAELLDRM